MNTFEVVVFALALSVPIQATMGVTLWLLTRNWPR